jgi:hypothetical protein
MRKWDIRKIDKKLAEWVARLDNKERLFDGQIRKIEETMRSQDPAQAVGLGRL